jgi:fatty-acyl-CoA synthase
MAADCSDVPRQRLGVPFAAAMLGIKVILPGPCLDASSLCELFTSERVTFSAGVPTVWMAMLRYLDEHPDAWQARPGIANAGWRVRAFREFNSRV